MSPPQINERTMFIRRGFKTFYSSRLVLFRSLHVLYSVPTACPCFPVNRANEGKSSPHSNILLHSLPFPLPLPPSLPNLQVTLTGEQELPRHLFNKQVLNLHPLATRFVAQLYLIHAPHLALFLATCRSHALMRNVCYEVVPYWLPRCLAGGGFDVRRHVEGTSGEGYDRWVSLGHELVLREALDVEREERG